MNTFETPKWVKVEGARLFLRRFETGRRLEPTLTDDQAIACAQAAATALAPGGWDEDNDRGGIPALDEPFID